MIHIRHLLSYLFALISVFINIQYFQIANGENFDLMASRYWLISIVLPLAIASYSHLCADYANGEVQVGNVVGWLREVWPFSRWWGKEQLVDNHNIVVDSESFVDEDESTVNQIEATVTGRENAILLAVRSGASTVYAIAKATKINPSTLRRKAKNGEYSGLIERLIGDGLLRETNGTIIAV